MTGRVTAIATMSGEVVQILRNHTASLILGLAPVRKLAANIVSEISLGYSHSPLNAPHAHHPPLPGKRAPIRSGEPMVGAGDTPRFALFAAADGGVPADLLKRYSDLLEPTLRAPYSPEGLWLVRPDGYVALAGRQGDWTAVAAYLDGIASDSRGVV